MIPAATGRAPITSFKLPSSTEFHAAAHRDHGTFTANIKEFENHGYVSRMQRERLETILEAGHAAMHRLYKPSKKDLVTLVDIAESLVESIYIHGTKVDALKDAIAVKNSLKVVRIVFDKSIYNKKIKCLQKIQYELSDWLI